MVRTVRRVTMAETRNYFKQERTLREVDGIRDLKQRRRQRERCKTIGVVNSTIALYVRFVFGTFLFAVLGKTKTSNDQIHGIMENVNITTVNFPFSIWTGTPSLRILLLDSLCGHIGHIERVGIIAK